MFLFAGFLLVVVIILATAGLTPLSTLDHFECKSDHSTVALRRSSNKLHLLKLLSQPYR